MYKYKVVLEFDPHDHKGNKVELYDEVIVSANTENEAEELVNNMNFGDRILNYVNTPIKINHGITPPNSII